MAENSQSTVKIVNSHPSKIDMVNFDGMNNFSMLRCEVMDTSTTSNLKDALLLEEKSEKTSTKEWNKMNRVMCGIIRSYLAQHIKYHVMTETSAKKI